MVHNCLTYALDRWIAEGGYIVWRKSEHWPVPHMLHVAPDGTISSYVPPEKLNHPLQALVGFDGEVRNTDPVLLARPMTAWGVFTGACLLLGGVLVWAAGRWIKRIKS